MSHHIGRMRACQMAVGCRPNLLALSGQSASDGALIPDPVKVPALGDALELVLVRVLEDEP